MYFSVITPTPGREIEAVHQLVQGAYSEHQWLWRFFPSAAGTPRDHIFRRADQGQAMRFYVVSRRPPTAFSEAWSVQTRPYAPALNVGDELDFELRANPVVTRRVNGKHHRHDVVMDAKKQLQATENPARTDHTLVRAAGTAWLTGQSQKHGFKLDESSLSVEAYSQHVGKHDKLRFSTLDFRGRLTVTQPPLLQAALALGLGHAKAFGCGLMLVRRPV